MTVHDFDLTGRRALVTGGGDGLGRQISHALLDAGADVVICGRRKDVLEQTASDMASLGQVTALQADLTVLEDVDRLVKQCGEVEILVNNAGLAHRAPWTSVTSEEWRRIMTLNVEAPLWLCQRLVPAMVARGFGRVINVASMYGLVAADPSRYGEWGSDMASYFASKHALIGLTKHLAVQLGRTGVTVNALCPGGFPSPANEQAMEPQILQRLNEGAPLGRLGSSTELRTGVLFLAAPGSSYVTGHSLLIDGGWTIW